MRTFLSSFVLALGVGVGLIGQSVSAAPLVLNPTKDTLICTYNDGVDSEQDCNVGGLATMRMQKNVYRAAFDFDTHGLVSGDPLYDWLVANGITPTGAGAKSAIDGGTLKVEFGVAQVGTQLSGRFAAIRTIDSLNDWIEGNGTVKYDEFAWTNLGGAATFNNPAQILPGEGAAKGPGWGTAGTSTFTAATYTTISAANLTWDANSASYGITALTSEGVRQLLDETKNRGFYLMYVGSNSNGEGYTREQTGTNLDPTLTFTIVPEPASVGLLGLLGGGLLLRRRREVH